MAEQDHRAHPAASRRAAGLLSRAMVRSERHLAPLGVPTVIIADDPALLATACAAYADWVADALAPNAAIELRLDTGSASTEKVSAAIRVEGSRLRLDGGGIAGEADARTGRAWCVVPPHLAGDPAALADVTDTLLLFLLARTGRTPVHAAGVMLGDTVLVLAGPSGSGKSTLALAAAGRGLPVLSDDTLYVQIVPGLRVWGFPRPIHVFAEDAPPGDHAVRLRGGKRKAIVPLPVGARGPRSAGRTKLIVLRRGEHIHLAPLAPAEAVDALSDLDAGFDLLAEQSAAAIGALAERGAWRLTLARDPGAAIDLLCERLAAG
jgi:hypothetical protein